MEHPIQIKTMLTNKIKIKNKHNINKKVPKRIVMINKIVVRLNKILKKNKTRKAIYKIIRIQKI